MSYILNETEIRHFTEEGFIRIDAAFPAELAAAVRDILWKDIPFDRDNPQSWTEPVVWLGMYSGPPFTDSLNTARLHTAFDQLAGAGKWLPCRSVGSFPVRFPSAVSSQDTGRHVDAGFPGDDPVNYFEWRINIRSKGRALLMLVLYSDVSENDAPSVLWKGSHKDVARLLYPEGEAGLSFTELAGRLHELPEREKAFATGKAGTVYLCHPFLVHAAQAHRGKTPRFMAQPPLLLKDALTISGPEASLSPVEQAIYQALHTE